jgi:hypothetical protein
MTLPTGDNAYVTAKGQFDWFKEELSVPELTYNDLMRLVETWIMGVPGEEVCAMSCIVYTCMLSHGAHRRAKTTIAGECIFMSGPGDHQYRRAVVYLLHKSRCYSVLKIEKFTNSCYAGFGGHRFLLEIG